MNYIIHSHPLYLIDRAIADAQATVRLQCPRCQQWYLLRPEPLALVVEQRTVTVRPGYVEVCPCCYAEHTAGTRLHLSEEVLGQES
jgi:hypothetical protein